MLEYDRLVLFRLLMLFEQIQQVGTSKLFRKRNPLDFRFADAHIRFPYHVLNERTLELRPFPIEYFTRKRIIAYSLRTAIKHHQPFGEPINDRFHFDRTLVFRIIGQQRQQEGIVV